MMDIRVNKTRQGGILRIVTQGVVSQRAQQKVQPILFLFSINPSYILFPKPFLLVFSAFASIKGK